MMKSGYNKGLQDQQCHGKNYWEQRI